MIFGIKEKFIIKPYNVLLSIVINIPVLLMTVLQGHIYFVQSIIMIITMSSIVILIVNLSHLYADVVLLAVWKHTFYLNYECIIPKKVCKLHSHNNQLSLISIYRNLHYNQWISLNCAINLLFTSSLHCFCYNGRNSFPLIRRIVQQILLWLASLLNAIKHILLNATNSLLPWVLSFVAYIQYINFP